MARMFRKNIVFQEMKQYRVSTSIWILALILIGFLFLSMYPAFVQDSSVFQDLIDSFPEATKKIAGFSESSFTSLIGFYGLALTYVILIGSVQAMSLGASLMSKEVSGKTSDFLLSKPISRVQVLASKYLAGLSLIVVTNLIFLPVMLVLTRVFFDIPPSIGVFTLTTFSLFFVQLFFFSLGFLLSVSMKKIKSVLAVTLPVVFGFYIVGMMDGFVGKENIRYFTPFKFFDFEYIDLNGTYEYQFLILLGALVAGSLYLSYKKYITKDIHAV